MDTTFIGLDLGLLLAIVYILEPNLPYYLKLRISEQFINLNLRLYQGVFRVRFWYDKQSLRPGPVGRFLREQQLRRIQRRYSDLFKDQP